MNNNWISIKDTLPSHKENVITFSHMGVKLLEFNNDSKTFYTDGIGVGNVTHWMKVPEKPNEMV